MAATVHKDEDGDYICDYGCGTQVGTPAMTGSIRLRSAALELKDKVFIIYKASNGSISANDADVVERGVLLYTSEALAATKDPSKAYASIELTWDASADRYIGRGEGIAAKDMGKSQFAVAYMKMADGSYIFGTKSTGEHQIIEYSPLIYCRNKKTDSQLGTLVAAMMHYGAAAQVQLGKETTGLMNEEFDAVTFDTNMLGQENFKADTTITNGMKLRSATMELSGAVSYIVKYSVEDASLSGKQLYAEYTLLGKTGSVKLVSGTDGRLWAIIEDVAAKDLDSTLTVRPYYLNENGEKVYGAELIYSAYEYARRTLASDKSADTLKNLAKALATYIYYADKIL